MTDRDKKEAREAFRRMSPGGKAKYVLTYYRAPILIAIIAIVILGSLIHRQLTKKHSVLYMAFINLSIGSDLETRLGNDFIIGLGLDPQKDQILFYRDLYISDNPSQVNHQMAYASRLKLMATLDGRLLDLALMNREAYNIFSESGYLLDLSTLAEADAEIAEMMEPHLTKNTVILSDNAIEVSLGEAETYEAVTEESFNGLEVTDIPFFASAGFSGNVYIGVIANTPRTDDCAAYLKYLLH